MSAYLIADVTDVSDRGLYERYQPLVPPSLRACNGSYLAPAPHPRNEAQLKPRRSPRECPGGMFFVHHGVGTDT